MGLFALCGSISADEVVDYLTGSSSDIKAYKIEVRRGPSGTSFSDNSSTPGFMLCNPNDANDDKAYSTWYGGTKFYNVAYNADAQYQHFLILKYAGHFYVVNMGNKKFLATADGTTVRFSADATPVNIDTYGTDANYRYFIVTEDGHQINFNSYNTTTGVTGTGTSKDAGSLISLSTTGTCSLTDAELSAVKEKITGWKESYKTELNFISQDKLGTLGYPTQPAYNTYKSVLDNESSTRSQVNTAKTTFLQSIVYPQDGQAYYIKGINKSGNAGYVYSTDDKKLGFKGAIPTEKMPSTAIFYCHKVGERKYVFTNNNGRYMRYRTDNSSDGFTDGYDEALNVWTLQPMRSGNSDSYDINRDNLNADFSTLGLFLMRAKRNDNNWNEDFYLMAGFSGNQFHAASATTVYYTASNQTSAFQLEAADQKNAFTTNALTVGTVSANIATYSSPFPVNLPDDVDAYIAKQEGENKVVLQKITGALPANTGVILSSETAKKDCIPTVRTTEPLATVNAEDNKLVATTGKAVPADVTAYILGKDKYNNSVAVFKKLSASDRTIAQYKAYLKLDGTQNAQLMNFAFAGSDLTGIQNVTETSAKSKTAYDLAGRKVGKLQKGIYIVNGKKVIVK